MGEAAPLPAAGLWTRLTATGPHSNGVTYTTAWKSLSCASASFWWRPSMLCARYVRATSKFAHSDTHGNTDATGRQQQRWILHLQTKLLAWIWYFTVMLLQEDGLARFRLLWPSLHKLCPLPDCSIILCSIHAFSVLCCTDTYIADCKTAPTKSSCRCISYSEDESLLSSFTHSGSLTGHSLILCEGYRAACWKRHLYFLIISGVSHKREKWYRHKYESQEKVPNSSLSKQKPDRFWKCKSHLPRSWKLSFYSQTRK